MRKCSKKLLKSLERLKLEVNDLVGFLSIRELTTNFRFIDQYKKLQQAYVRI